LVDVTADRRLEFFFHQSALETGTRFDQLHEGQHVSFLDDTEQALAIGKGPRATKVTVFD
jgi:cold shock CspA family protein